MNQSMMWRRAGSQRRAMTTLLLMFILLTTTSANTILNKAHVKCEDDAAPTCRVSFELDDGTVHTAELIPEETSLFAIDATISDFSGNDFAISNRKLDGTRYHTRLNEGQWATALISHDGRELLGGIFSTEKHGIIEWERDLTDSGIKSAATRRRASAIDIGEDVVLDPPGGKPWITHSSSEQSRIAANDVASNASTNVYGQIIPFFPNCFPQDTVTHVVKLNLIFDYSVYSSLAAGMTGTDADKQSQVLANLEGVFSPGKLLYLSQLNVRLEVNKVLFGSATDPLPFSRGSSQAPCQGALSTMTEFMNWLSTNNPKNPTGYWILMSNCFSSINGVSYIGSLCGSTGNGGVAAYSWSVMFHELGHGFGSSHSFEFGVGKTGGLMDYGDTLYNGVTQFHPLKRPEVCSYLSYLKTSTSCPFFVTAAANSNCGDGVLSKDEQCECLTSGSKSCGKCVGCKLTDPKVECSSADFIVRNSLSPDLVVVEAAALASSDCCIRNRFAPPKTLCGPGLLNACGAAGECTALCTLNLLSNNPNCGFDNSGCMLGCVWKSRCRFDMSFTGPDGNDQFISALPDGTSCVTLQGTIGMCQNTTCASGPPSTTGSPVQLTAQPTPAPSLPPTSAVTLPEATFRPTKRPVAARSKTHTPTSTPTAKAAYNDPGAQLNMNSRCAVFKTKKKCNKAFKGKCTWCNRSSNSTCSYDPC